MFDCYFLNTPPSVDSIFYSAAKKVDRNNRKQNTVKKSTYITFISYTKYQKSETKVFLLFLL